MATTRTVSSVPSTGVIPEKTRKSLGLEPLLKVSVKIRTFSAAGTLRRKHAVVIVNTVDLIVHVHGERNSVQALVADAASEAPRVVGFPHGLQDHFHDEVTADCTLFRRLLEARVLKGKKQYRTRKLGARAASDSR